MGTAPGGIPQAPEATRQSRRATAPRLRRGALGLADITASTMANIGPAMSFYFGFALLAATAGVASPLTIIVAGVAVALLGNTLAEFSKSIPSAGSFITFIGKTFGPVPALTAAVVASAGYIIAAASVVAISGGWLAIILSTYLHVNVPWQLLAAGLALLALGLLARGVSVSTKWAGMLFAFEIGLMLVVSVWVLAAHAGHLTLAPFEPSHLASGFKGLGLAFPLAVYLFVGWENSASLAEETASPRRAVPRAVYLSIASITLSYVLFSYVTVVGFGYNPNAMAAAPVPFIAVARHVIGGAAVLAYLAGLTSIMGCLTSAANSQARLIFNSGREGLLPSAVARVTRRGRIPWVSFVVYLALALAITFTWGWKLSPVTFFGEAATLGTILILVTWLAANLALPVYYRRSHPGRFSLIRHAVLPLAGAAAIVFPLYELVKPGQPEPYGVFPLISLALIAGGIGYALVLNARNPALAERIGSLIADAD